MNKKLIIYPLAIVFIVIMCFVHFFYKTIDGYYYDIDNARNDETKRIYKNAEYLFTAQSDNKILDFVINGDILSIVSIEEKGKGRSLRYSFRSSSTTPMKYHMSDNTYDWTSSAKLNFCSYKYAIVPEEFNKTHDNYPAFRFDYNGESYHLCYVFNE